MANSALKKAHDSVPKACGAWGIYRDGELYGVEMARWMADELLQKLRHGSKHGWRVTRIWIEPKGVS